MHFICVIGILVLVFLIYPDCTEGLIAKPSDAERIEYIDAILNNRTLFTGRYTYYSAKEKIPWLDALIYEEIRQLVRQNNLNKKSLLSVFL